MIRSTKSKWFEVWGTEAAQNRFLKGLLALFVVLCSVQATALVALSLRKPVLVALSPSETKWLVPSFPQPELFKSELQRILSTYVRVHHNWDWSTVDSQLQSASRLVAPEFSTKFLQANGNQAKLTKEKKLSQRFYFAESELKVDLDRRKARITGDRILLVEGLRATNPMTLELGFHYGERSPTNPEGIYITSEDLVQDSK